MRWMIQVHTRDKPFHCTDCGTRFTQKGALKVHMQRKHAETFDEEEFKRMSEAQEKQVCWLRTFCPLLSVWYLPHACTILCVHTYTVLCVQLCVR